MRAKTEESRGKEGRGAGEGGAMDLLVSRSTNFPPSTHLRKHMTGRSKVRYITSARLTLDINKQVEFCGIYMTDKLNFLATHPTSLSLLEMPIVNYQVVTVNEMTGPDYKMPQG